MNSFTHTTLGATGLSVHRLGLSASYWPGKQAIHAALDAGINYVFAYGIDGQMVRTMRDAFKTDRKRYVLATGAYNLLLGHPNIRRTLEKRLRQFRTEYIDIFMFLGVTKPSHLSERTLDKFRRLKEEGLIGHIGMSCHDRTFAGQMAARGAMDVLMIRYNAAHRGAERDIFPLLAPHDPGIVSYTATRWTALLRRPRTWPKGQQLPTAGQCYRFVLSHPAVHVCMTAPSNFKQLKENLDSLSQGPLTGTEMTFMRSFGDAVYQQHQWFM